MPPPPRGLLGAGSSSAAWPVSAMNTSSSVGRCSAMSSMPTPASSSRRTASAITPERSRTGHAARCRRRSVGPLGGHLGQRGDRRARRRPSSSSVHLEPLAADAVLELVRGALGDHGAVVDHDDPVGEAVGLVEVLRGEQHGRARRGARLDRLPHAERGCAGRGPSSARRGTAPAGGRRARRRGRAAGACRPSRSWRAACAASVSSKRSSSSSARSRASVRGRW